jgi:hypothetical protein
MAENRLQAFNLAALSHRARTRQPSNALMRTTAAVQAGGKRNFFARSGLTSLAVEQGASRAEKRPAMSIEISQDAFDAAEHGADL